MDGGGKEKTMKMMLSNAVGPRADLVPAFWRGCIMRFVRTLTRGVSSRYRLAIFWKTNPILRG